MTSSRRLSRDQAEQALASATPIPTNRGASPILVTPLDGTDLGGSPSRLDLTARTHRSLLLFVSLDCTGCEDVIAGLVTPELFGVGPEDEIIVIFRSLAHEEVESIDSRLGGATCLISASAFDAYGVSGPPFFSYVDPSLLTVFTEGVAWGTDSVASALGAAQSGTPSLEAPRLGFPHGKTTP